MDDRRHDTQPAGALVPSPPPPPPIVATPAPLSTRPRPAAGGGLPALVRDALDELDLLGDRIASALGLRGS